MNTNFWIQTWIHTHRLQRPLLYWSLSQKKQERAVLSQKEEESAQFVAMQASFFRGALRLQKP